MATKYFHSRVPKNNAQNNILINKSKDNDKYYYFEHAWMDSCMIMEFSSYMDAIKYIKNNHYQCSLEYSDILGLTKDDLSVYEFDKPKKDSSIPEYFDNIFENGKKIDI